MKKIRLAKYLANSGVASRRKCEEMIFQGRVLVNGSKTILPQTMVDEKDKILLNGKPISQNIGKAYFILNKPAGYVCTTEKKFHKKLVLDLFKEENKRLFTAGRLDKDTTGLIIVTNDGELANKIIHPRYNIQKEYIAKTDQEITSDHLKKIAKGVRIDDTNVMPYKVKKVRRATVKIIVLEGKKREVRALLKNAGLIVLELKRVRIGALRLGNLPVGFYRTMTEREREIIFE